MAAASSGAPQRGKGAEFILAGTSACCAITLTNPVDVVKTRLQLQGELVAGAAANAKPSVAYRGVGHALYRIGASEGLRGLQRGLCAAYLLQFSNVGCRFGGYDYLKRAFGVKVGDSATGQLTLVAMGAASGTLAAVVSNPFFLLKTRFQAAGSEDARHQHKYASLRSAFVDIGRQEGFRGYYRGISVFAPRVAAASAVQLSTYDAIKEYWMRWIGTDSSFTTHFAASLLTGVAVTLAMQPFDFTAVRLMNQGRGEGGAGAFYTGPWDCISKTVEAEGVRGVFKGTLANYLRFGPYCVFTFVILEQLRAHWDRMLL
mmetsp:Transcript_6195/g.15177  ORF Transcript_6195/g.15177 Transcript_6195/m.15177 type:complete len:316 (-) Transcript_6195:40-987(-)